ncbi:anti-sigma factor [Nocardiopsis valliformis]|uniref:anti-sigma factor n=1 Tax=Nocardiopsis valliformis TaxID=239974 RepID=UPI000348DD32|nr:anti-sigma factor [Nocardiopsis valliformis]
MSGVEAHGLIAGYAVDALEPEERAEAERHLAGCEECRRDLEEFRETLVRLAYSESSEPSAELWSRISASARRNRQAPPASAPDHVVPGPGRWWRGRLPWLVAAACTLVAVVLGATLVAVDRHLDDMSRRTAAVEELLAAPDTHMHEGDLGGEARATAFTSYEMDALMLVVEGLPEAPSGMAYQVWYVDEDGMRSAGMLEPSPDGRYSALSHDMGEPVQVGVSLEPESGMPEPSEPPMKFDL